MRVRSLLKFLFESKGSIKLRAQLPATVTDVSWPSLAEGGNRRR